MTAQLDCWRVAAAVGLVAIFDLLLAGSAFWLVVTPRMFDDSAALKEEAAYRAYRLLFGPEQPGPADCHSPDELDHLRFMLAGPLAPPQEYAHHWRETPEVLLHAKWTKDVALLSRTRQDTVRWYRERIAQGTALLVEPRYDADWAARTAPLVAERRPWPLEDVVLGSASVPHPRGEPLTHADVALCREVQRAAADWEQVRQRLSGWPDLLELLELIARRAGILPACLF